MRKPHRALACIKEAIQEHGARVELICEQAAVYFFIDDSVQAAASATEALKLDPRSVQALLYLAMTNSTLGNRSVAQWAYEKLLQIDPAYGIAYTNRGLLYEELGRRQDALNDFDQAIRINPADHKAHYNRANLLYEIENYDEAIAAYENAIRANPVYLMAYGNLGATHLEMGQYEKAIEDFTNAIHCEPRAILPLVNRGIAYSKLGNSVAAYSDLQRAIDLSPLHPWPVTAMADLLEQEGRWHEALQFYDKAALLLDSRAKAKARELRAKIADESSPDESAKVGAAFPVRTGDQWLDSIVYWLQVIEKDPALIGSDTFWKGLPFPEVLATIRQQAVGSDAYALRGRGNQAVNNARTAYKDRRPRAAIQYLYWASAYYLLGADLNNLSTALGNLGAMFAELRQIDRALRVQSYALNLKIMIGSPKENISRSLRIMSQLEQFSGNYLAARNLYEESLNAFGYGDTDRTPREPDELMKRLDDMIFLSSERSRMELEPPSTRSSVDLMGDAKSIIETDPRGAAVSLFFAIDAARRSGDVKQQLEARKLLGELIYSHFGMYREAYNEFAGVAILAARLNDIETECDARMWQSRTAAEMGDAGTSRELMLLALSKLSNGPPSRVRADILISLSLACQEMELEDEGKAYLDMALRDASSFPQTDEGLEWFEYQARTFRKMDLSAAAAQVLISGIFHIPDYGRQQLKMLEQLAHIYYESRQWHEVIKVLELAVSYATALEDIPAQARNWTHLGLTALEVEDFKLAEHARQQAEALDVKPEDPAAQEDLMSLSMQLMAVESSQVLIDLNARHIGESFRLQPEAGRNILRTKINRLLASSDPDPLELGDSYCALAILNDRLGRTGLAIAELFEGLINLRRLNLQQRRADLLQVYANILLRRRRVRSAWRALRAAVVARERFDPGRSPGPLLALIGECRLSLYGEEGVGELIKMLEQAGDFPSEWESPEGLLILSRLHHRFGDVDKAATLADALVERTSSKPDSERHACSLAWAAGIRVQQNEIDEAEALAQKVFELAEARERLDSSYDRVNWRRDCTQASEALIAAWSSRSNDKADQALALVESLRIRSLLERFGLYFLSTPDSFPDDLKKQEQLLLTMVRVQDRNKGRLDPELSWRMEAIDGLGNYQRDLLEFWAKLPEPWRAYGQLRLGHPGDPQLIVKQTLAATNSDILVLFPTGFGTYVWHLKSDGSIVTWRRAEVTVTALQDFCYRFRAALSEDRPSPEEGQKMAEALLYPELNQIPVDETICIVPSGPLLQLPYGALPYNGGYLIERNPVAILPALSLLPYWKQLRTTRPSDRVVVLGDSLGDLEGARNEADAVAKVFQVSPLIGEDIIRSSLVPALRRCDLLHVACHAFYDERDPAGSGFSLADRSVFSARDFAGGELSVRVAVMSACESGLLDIAAGDELAGLASSLLICGASTVVSTLWRIPDQHSCELMTQFYGDFTAKGQDMARALALAQRDLLREPSSRSPYNWAAFQLFGLWQNETE